MAKSCMVASLVTCQNLMIILARFWSGHHGQILRGSITSDLPEPYGNLGKILVRSLWPNSCMVKPFRLDKILPFSWQNLNLVRYLGRIRCEPWNLARQSWLVIQDTCKILGNIFSRVWKAVELQLLHRHTQRHLLWSLKVS